MSRRLACMSDRTRCRTANLLIQKHGTDVVHRVVPGNAKAQRSDYKFVAHRHAATARQYCPDATTGARLATREGSHH